MNKANSSIPVFKGYKPIEKCLSTGGMSVSQMITGALCGAGSAYPLRDLRSPTVLVGL